MGEDIDIDDDVSYNFEGEEEYSVDIDSGEDAQPQRAEYLLEGYESADDQARAYHEFVSKHGKAEEIQQRLQHFSQLDNFYRTNPNFKQAVDSLYGRQQQQSPQQQQPQQQYYDLPEEVPYEQWNQYYDQIFQKPKQYFASRKEFADLQQQNQQYQQRLSQLEYTLNQQREQQFSSQHKDILDKLPLSLRQSVLRGQTSIDDVKSLLGSQQANADSQVNAGKIQRQRNTDGTFSRTNSSASGNGKITLKKGFDGKATTESIVEAAKKLASR